MGSRESAIVYYVTNIATEVMGMVICVNGLQSPDILSIIKYSLFVCIAIDIFRTIASLVAIIFAFIWGTTTIITADLKSTLKMVTYIVTGSGLVISIGLCIFYEVYYDYTDMASTPWLRTYYSLGVLGYALMKTILFVSGGYFMADYINSLPIKAEYVHVQGLPQPREVEMAQRYQRVPVYTSE